MPVYTFDDLARMNRVQEVLDEATIYKFDKNKNAKKINVFKDSPNKKLKHDYRLKLMKGEDQGLSVEFPKDKDLPYDELKKNYIKNDDAKDKDIKNLNKDYKSFAIAAAVYAREEIKEYLSHENSIDETKIQAKLKELYDKAKSYKEDDLKPIVNEVWKERNPGKELPKSDK